MKSLWVFHVNTGACNGCDIEILDVLTPYYDIERLGVKLVPTPRHAHALLVTGPLTRQAYHAAKMAYEAMPPKPRIVIAVGTCACSGGIFHDSYALRREYRESLEYPLKGGTSEFLPVHLYIPGCPRGQRKSSTALRSSKTSWRKKSGKGGSVRAPSFSRGRASTRG
ncbi:NADH-quinone oxidoreductase subunit B family protein [Thermococcus indicus]|uniref:NADH-quinone oxidoreductase subunit B family protein n=1 Tax=Thermococcus indicus TaxID=2586643 RepID=UPI001F0D662E|nr:hypothetical protein [Thermococcus indicus]